MTGVARLVAAVTRSEPGLCPQLIIGSVHMYTCTYTCTHVLYTLYNLFCTLLSPAGPDHLRPAGRGVQTFDPARMGLALVTHNIVVKLLSHNLIAKV